MLVCGAAVGLADTSQWPYNTGVTESTISYVRKPVTNINFTQIATGKFHTVGLVGSIVYTWGSTNADSQLGRAGAADVPTALTIWKDGSGLPITAPTIIQVAAGDTFCLAVSDVGTIYRWGTIPGSVVLTAPQEIVSAVTGDMTASAVYAGGDHAFFLTNKIHGTTKLRLYGWGGNASGQTGVAASPSVSSPVDVTGNFGGGQPFASVGIKAFSAGGHNSGLIRSNGTVQTWGDNTYGQLGNGNTTSSNLPQDGLSGGVAIVNGQKISVGYDVIAVTRGTGTVSTAGNNDEGQLGRTGSANQFADLGLTAVTNISAGYKFCMATTATTLYRWGMNVRAAKFCEVTTTPTVTPGFSGITALAAGNFQYDPNLADFGSTFVNNGGGQSTVSSLALVPVLVNTRLSSSTFVGGKSGVMTVTMSEPVLVNTNISLATTGASLQLTSGTATVLAGNSSADVPFNTIPVSVTEENPYTATQSAGWAVTWKTVEVRTTVVNDILILNATTPSAPVHGGNIVQIIATLAYPAPAAGYDVAYTSSNTSLIVSGTIHFNGGDTQGSVTVSVKPVPMQSKVQISMQSVGGLFVSRFVTVNP